MRILVVSSGSTAPPFVRDLSREHDVVVVHDGEEARDELGRLDVEVVEGVGTDPEVLTRAGIDMAAHFIAWSESDEINIISCLAARRLSEVPTICRVEKEEYVQTFGGGNGDASAGQRKGVAPGGREQCQWIRPATEPAGRRTSPRETFSPAE